MSFGRLHTRALKKRPSSGATVWPSRSAGCAASCTSGFTACVPVLLSGQRLLFFSLLHLTRSNRYLTTTCFFFSHYTQATKTIYEAIRSAKSCEKLSVFSEKKLNIVRDQTRTLNTRVLGARAPGEGGGTEDAVVCGTRGQGDSAKVDRHTCCESRRKRRSSLSESLRLAAATAVDKKKLQTRLTPRPLELALGCNPVAAETATCGGRSRAKPPVGRGT
jgi:hypothetical protein